MFSSLRSSVLQLFDKKRFDCIMTTDVMDESGLASEKVLRSLFFHLLSLFLWVSSFPRMSA